ncbi:MAG: hypothetical protein RR054_03595, partial [Clostridia bacterium]
DSIVMPISLYDIINVEKSERNEVNITIKNDKDVFGNKFSILKEQNTAYKAVMLFKELFSISDGFNIEIEKNIPCFSGLGGSSADGAAVIKALIEMYKLDNDEDEINAAAAEIGKDVPFMLHNQIAIISGFGEQVRKVNGAKFDVGIINCPIGNSTKDVYEKFDQLGGNELNSSLSEQVNYLLEQGDYEKAKKFMKNDLSTAAFSLNEQMRTINKLCKDCNIETFVTGSGSGMFVPFITQTQQQKLKDIGVKFKTYKTLNNN